MTSTIRTALVASTAALVLPVLTAGPALAAAGDGPQGSAASAAQGGGNGPSDKSSDKRSDSRETSPTDPSGSAPNTDGTFQGRSGSTPDQDGRGPDRDGDSNDKTGGSPSGGVTTSGSTDGNNGCGNEPRAAAPRDGGRPTEDDNEGWCGGMPRSSTPSTPGEDRDTDRDTDRNTDRDTDRDTGRDAGRDEDEREETPGSPVQGGGSADLPVRVVDVPAVGGGAVLAPVQGDRSAAGTPVRTPLTGTPASAVVEAGVLSTALTAPGTRVSASPLPGLDGAGTQVSAQASAAATPTALPFTGSATALLLVTGGAALAAGAGLVAAGRRRTA